MQILYTIDMEDDDTKAFLAEREEKIGGRIVWKTYSTYFAALSGEIREYGVFLYSNGKAIVLEDFERAPSIFGIALRQKKKNEYKKLEIMIDIDNIEAISLVTRSSAIDSIRRKEDKCKVANRFDRVFRKLLTKIELKDGTILFLELLSHKDFRAWIIEINKEIK